MSYEIKVIWVRSSDKEDHVAADGGFPQRTLADDFAKLPVEIVVGQEGFSPDKFQETLLNKFNRRYDNIGFGRNGLWDWREKHGFCVWLQMKQRQRQTWE